MADRSQQQILGQALGLGEALSEHLAHRAPLKAAGMWPSPGSGRGKGYGRARRARPATFHRNSFSFAGSGDTVDMTVRPVRAAEYVREWRSLVLQDGQLTRVRRSFEPAQPGERMAVFVERTERIAPGDNAAEGDLAAILFAGGARSLGEIIDRLPPTLVRLAAPFGGVKSRPAGFGDELRLRLVSGPRYHAIFEAVPPIGDGFRATFVRPDLLDLPPAVEPGGTRSFTLNSSYLLLLAELEEADLAEQTHSGPAVHADPEKQRAAEARISTALNDEPAKKTQTRSNNGNSSVASPRRASPERQKSQALPSLHVSSRGSLFDAERYSPPRP